MFANLSFLKISGVNQIHNYFFKWSKIGRIEILEFLIQIKICLICVISPIYIYYSDYTGFFKLLFISGNNLSLPASQQPFIVLLIQVSDCVINEWNLKVTALLSVHLSLFNALNIPLAILDEILLQQEASILRYTLGIGIAI